MIRWLRDWLTGTKKDPDPMKYLFVGIGNIGPDYVGTRHNIGFDIVDRLASDHGATFANDQKGDVCEIKHKGRAITLLKPSTYVNLSGKAVTHWMSKKNISRQNLLVILDDMNLEFGQQRLRGKGSDGGHNGLKSINSMIGSNYARLRIGIGRGDYVSQVDHVLGKWSREEEEQLPAIIEQAAETALSFAAIGLAHTMNKFNK